MRDELSLVDAKRNQAMRHAERVDVGVERSRFDPLRTEPRASTAQS